MLRLTPMHAVAAAVVAFGATGCGVTINLEDDCHWTLTCSCAPDRPSADSSTTVADDCGIFASSSFGDDANPGSKAQPVATLTKALELANSGKRPLRIYACAETFREAVKVPAEMTVYGGFDCHAGWIRSSLSKNTVLVGSPGQIPLIVESDIEERSQRVTRIERLDVQAADGQARGESSIAVLVQPDISAVLEDCNVTAGNGADGVDGAPGDPQNTPARAGTPGNKGQDACTADIVPGGVQAQTECGDVDSYGGYGGDGTPMTGSAGADGQPAPIPNPASAGLGGSGEDAVGLCTWGKDGAPGADGEHGQGAHEAARLGLSGYLGSWGRDGTVGMPGQGGGGGGGAKAGVLFCGALPSGGASGGSGGGGGCGGKPGRGGGPGGASIGVIDLSGQLFLRGGSVRAGSGGQGGVGGWLQLGGTPASGKVGGSGKDGSQAGCAGGPGGRGGDGGIGGGGLGGASIGIAYADDKPMTGMDPQPGMPGRGGGNPAFPFTLASDGESGDIVPLHPAD